MHIREALHIDYPKVNPILVEVELLHARIEPDIFCPIQAYDFDHYCALVDSDNSAIFIAEETDGEVLGALVALVGEWPELDIFKGGRYVVVQELSVTESAKRKGIGKALMATVEEWATVKGIDILHLSVCDRNRDAIAFYKALGYESYIHSFQKKLNPQE